MIEATIPFGDAEELVLLLGTSDQHLRRIRDAVPAKISTRNGKIHVSGDEQAVLQATEILEQIKTSTHRNGALSPDEVTQIIRQVTGGGSNGRQPPVDVKLYRRNLRGLPLPSLGDALDLRVKGRDRQDRWILEPVRPESLVPSAG